MGAVRAVARSTDPETSHAAAASVGDLRLSQASVLRFLTAFGPMSDELLCTIYDKFWRQYEYPQQSPSGIRSRRAELVRLGLVVDTGEKVEMTTGRMAKVWGATS